MTSPLPEIIAVDEVPPLERHGAGRPALLVACQGTGWGRDVVLHLHGYSAAGAALDLAAEKWPLSGIDLAARGDRPTIALLPRGRWFGGRSGAAFDFPALTEPPGARVFLAWAEGRLGFRRRRLIITAHSGGGAAAGVVARALDADEVHLFDAVYGPLPALVTWAEARLAAEAAGAASGTALRILYRADSPTEGPSLALMAAIGAIPAASAAGERFRADPVAPEHDLVGQVLGPVLLADPTARIEPPPPPPAPPPLPHPSSNHDGEFINGGPATTLE